MKIMLFWALTFISIKGMPNDNSPDLAPISGSWMNSQVYEYYIAARTNACDAKFFEKRSSVPLCLSFNINKQIEITFRYEQKIGIYHIKRSAGDSIMAYNGKRVLKMKRMKDLLVMEYEGRTVAFKNVSPGYSKDVFGEFVKSLVFEKHDSYTIESFGKNEKFNNRIVDRENFRKILKEVFGCESIDFVPLGLFKYGESCLPEVALYYASKGITNGPKVVGVRVDNGVVELIDSSGVVVLRLKSSR